MQTILLHAPRFTDPHGHVPFLAPWWGVPREDPDSLHRGQFAAWAGATGLPYVLANDPAEAAVFVLSIPWKLTRSDPAARTFAAGVIQLAARHGRPVVIFFDSDHDEPVAWPPHAIVFRFSIYRDTRHPNEFSIPTFSQDFLAESPTAALSLRKKGPVPSVSFCGYAPPLGCQWSRTSLRAAGRYVAYRLGLLAARRQWIAHALRVQALLALRRTRGIETHFILRDQFAFNRWGVLQPGGTPGTAGRQRAEFAANLADADYALCTRGLANCSIRFYEAMSLGRIPLFINTACVLPYDWLVDWPAACVWVEEAELAAVGRHLRARHAALSEENFTARQRHARELFVRWLAPEGFFRELHRHFDRIAPPFPPLP